MDKTIKEITYGALFGYAAGDALGLGTEFMTKSEIKRRYPQRLTRYSQIVRDAHRSLWSEGDFSNDTHFISLIVESICDRNEFDYMDYARRLHVFCKSNPIDLTANIRWVTTQPDFVNDPIGTAQKIWKAMEEKEAPSDALGRALIAGMWDRDVKKNAEDICLITHPNSRCRASSVIIAKMANSLMWHDKVMTYDDVVAVGKEEEPDVIRYIEIARHGTLADFNLDHENSFWYVRKAMGCALWAVWHCKTPDEAVIAIANEGGDADGNAALAAGLVGIRDGFSAIERHFVDGLREKGMIQALADRFTECLTRNFSHKESLKLNYTE